MSENFREWIWDREGTEGSCDSTQLGRTRKGVWHPQSAEVKKEDKIRGNVPHWAVEEAEQLSGERLPEYVCVCVCVPHMHTAKVTYELPGNCPWGRKTLGSASWGPRGFTRARMSRMERQGIFPELPQGWVTTEGSDWGELSRPPLSAEEETEMQG